MADSGRVLIIGKTGQVARSLYDVLSGAGHSVAVIGRPEVDLCNSKSVRAAISEASPAIVVNAAAYTAVERAEDEPDLAFSVNVEGARAVAEAAADVGAPVVHLSTDYVFDGGKREPYVETDATTPLNVYGRSKRAGEEAVAIANPKHVILRTAWVFSPFGANFVKTMLRLNAERDELRVVDDQWGCPTSALDLAAAIGAVIERLGVPAPDAQCFGIFHAVNSGATTWFEFANAIIDGASLRGGRRAAVFPVATKDYPSKVNRPLYTVLSTDKLADVYGIRLRPWSDALPGCLDRLIGPLQHQEAFGKSA